MVVASSIFSWLIGSIWTMLGFIFLGMGHYVSVLRNGQVVRVHEPYSGAIWFLWFLFVFFRLFILIWRQISVSRGRKIGCGICTLLFVSVLGGIFTLCIPTRPSAQNQAQLPLAQQPNVAQEEAIVGLLGKYRRMLDDGTITQAEFDAKKAELLQRQSPQRNR